MEIDPKLTFRAYGLLVILSFIFGCDSACTANDAIAWDPVRNESAYDRDPQSLNDVNAGRPLGFKHAVLEYIDNADPMQPCVTITGCVDRRLEIMFETDPLAMICVKDVTTDSANPICSERIYSCGQCPATGDGSVTYQFSCSGQSCDQSSVGFWFRFVVSDDPAVLDPETWCDGRNSDEYPTSLIQRVPVVPPPQATEPPAGSSSQIATNPLFFMLSIIIVWLNKVQHILTCIVYGFLCNKPQ